MVALCIKEFYTFLLDLKSSVYFLLEILMLLHIDHKLWIKLKLFAWIICLIMVQLGIYIIPWQFTYQYLFNSILSNSDLLLITFAINIIGQLKLPSKMELHTVFPHIVSAETILFWLWPYVLWPLITLHKCAETIQGRKLFKGGNYMRKYGKSKNVN